MMRIFRMKMKGNSHHYFLLKSCKIPKSLFIRDLLLKCEVINTLYFIFPLQIKIPE